MTVDGIEIKEISSRETLAIRHLVLRPHQTLEECVFEGDDDPITFHLGAFDVRELIGITTVLRCTNEFFPNLTDTFRLRGMAVLPARQRGGIGGKLLESAQLEAQLRGCSTFWCNARVTAEAFYRKSGFQPQSDEPFEIEGIGLHYVMVKTF